MNNNPMRYTDPSGHDPVGVLIALALAIYWASQSTYPVLAPDTGMSDTLTLYSIQPVEGTEIPVIPPMGNNTNYPGELEGSPDVGHTFIQITDGQTGKTYIRGFYPAEPPKNPLLTNFTEIEMRGEVRMDDSLLLYSDPRLTRVSFPISDEGFDAALAMINADEENPPDCNLHTYNCVDWALDVAEEAGINYAPNGKRWWHPWISTPATLGTQSNNFNTYWYDIEIDRLFD